MVAEELHLDVARATHEFFQEDLVFAEGGLGLAAPGGHLLGEVVRRLDDPHAAPAAAPARLGHERKADPLGDVPGLGLVFGQRAARRHDGKPGPNRKLARRHFGAQ